MKFVMSYSCGKDSTLSLYRMIKAGHEPLALLITVDKKVCRSWFHGVPKHLLEEVSKSLNIPLLLVESIGDNYKETFEEALGKAKEQGAEACVFGDIDLEAHRTWCTDRCEAVGLEVVFPLWLEDREVLTHEFIDLGFTTVLKNVKLECLGEEFLGKVLTKELVEKIKATGSDACGENGEYHSFVYDGPLFSYPVSFEVGENILTETHGYLDIK
ncbi:diphthine--ammonia ligase [Turicibacter sanguinis]|uniref:Diphthine--ammonia ligase n=1 Tax=Turicibacter sanguinis TaxID=154288 RepID=A0A6I3NCF7_9FIRM|nr:diphthine--ammonia ligase [Turicibacter sanguinis]MTK69137.1 diphthine--ammonia ligase [Turicibacter sanguinis]MTK79690.1 diphthine--ammonia ligase [Turicibacter sanguinis]MTK82624.1 diphthine--ammonia ligase [Turicibacter sanguinis]MTK85513.1 diphthine--ammonia ligase [Turicibacter sanguinis]MTK94013.1 diphthine--ammonia ligase [Turicibacter sanguinis]